MQKIDAGITVADVIEASTLGAEPNPEIAHHIGALTEAKVAEVSMRYRQAKSILDDAITNSGNSPQDYLPDWDTSNVMVEGLRTPVAGSNFMLWVIDQ